MSGSVFQYVLEAGRGAGIGGFGCGSFGFGPELPETSDLGIPVSPNPYKIVGDDPVIRGSDP